MSQNDQRYLKFAKQYNNGPKQGGGGNIQKMDLTKSKTIGQIYGINGA